MVSILLPLLFWLLPYTLNSHVNGSLISAFAVFARMMPLFVSWLDTVNGLEAKLLTTVEAFIAPCSSTSTFMMAVGSTLSLARLETVPLKCTSGRTAVPLRPTSGVVLPFSERRVKTRLSPSTCICQLESSQVGLTKPFGLLTVMVGRILVPDNAMLFTCSLRV